MVLIWWGGKKIHRLYLYQMLKSVMLCSWCPGVFRRPDFPLNPSQFENTANVTSSSVTLKQTLRPRYSVIVVRVKLGQLR